MASWTRVKRLLKAKKLPIYKFAIQVGVKRQTAYNWLSKQKRPRPERVAAIAAAIAEHPEDEESLRLDLLTDISRW